MLLPVRDLHCRLNVRPKSVLHVGAHDAEESVAYSEHGWKPVVWVEMLRERFLALKAKFAGDEFNQVYQAACWDSDGVMLRPYIANNVQSSSLLEPKLHLAKYPEITFTKGPEIVTSRLDRMLPASSVFDFVNLDIQGAELRALKGLGDRLHQARWLYLEVNIAELYSGCALLPELDLFAHDNGFTRVALRLNHDSTWGDALYMNRGHFSSLAILETRHIGEILERDFQAKTCPTRISSLSSALATGPVGTPNGVKYSRAYFRPTGEFNREAG